MSAVAHADDTTFDHEVLESDVPVVVDFWASWCGPCRVVAPELEALAAEHGDTLKVVKVDVDAAPERRGSLRRPGHSRPSRSSATERRSRSPSARSRGVPSKTTSGSSDRPRVDRAELRYDCRRVARGH